MNRLTFVLLVLGAGLALLIFNHDSGRTFGIDNNDFGRLIYMIPIAGLLGAGIVAGRRGAMNEVLRNLAVWLVIILGLVAAYLYRNDANQFVGRMTAGLLPGHAVVVTGKDGDEVVIQKAIGGHFQANVSVNGKTIQMLVDTGASSIVLSFDDAKAIGIDTDGLAYTIPVMTANGQAMVAPVRLNEIAIGPILRRNVRAMVAADGRLDESLLGMSFLSTLSSFNMQPDELRLRD
ncbi:TIGR02281 family clan AA aspartic protease [Neorhizobium sp. NCHU2750]|uniref:TIGR02281 family clan AA aspartic protease n=1 Tax=Neorhizobium sp. NCHU2750 TaxID=1825976 RepID=UPI000E73FF74|nr:aspartyl protease [Neorhizobium sp. NCHU2750]